MIQKWRLPLGGINKISSTGTVEAGDLRDGN